MFALKTQFFHPKVINWMKTFIGAEGQKIFFLIILLVIAQLSTFLLSISLGNALSFVLPYHPYRAKFLTFLPDTILGDFNNFLLFLALLLLVKIFLDWGSSFFTEKIGAKAILELQKILFKNQLKLPLDLYREKGVSRYLLRWSGDLTSVKALITKGFIQFLGDLFLLLLILFSAWIIFPTLRWDIFVMALLFPLYYGISYWVLSKKTSKKRNYKSSLLKFVSQRLHNIEMIQALNRVTPENSRFQTSLKKAHDSLLKEQYFQKLLISIGRGLYFATLIWLVFRSPALTSEEKHFLLPAFFIWLSASASFRRVSRIGICWTKGWISLNKLQYILETPQDDSRNLPYKYRSGILAIGNNSEIKINEGTGIFWLPIPKGYTAPGVLKALMGLAPQDGLSISWDGQPIENLQGMSLRKKICVISKDHALMGKNVFEAISYSRKSIKKKPAQDMINRLQEGLDPKEKMTLDQKIGEFGAKLSEEQKLLLKFARAFLSKKPIVLIYHELKDGHRYFPWVWQILREEAKEKRIFIIQAPELSLVASQSQ